jgi:hypothetical protein
VTDGADPAPSSSTTLVVLLGASRYPRMATWDNPVLGTSAADVRAYAASGMALPPAQVLDLFDDPAPAPAQCAKIEAFLAGHPGARDLIVYYIGHGAFDEEEYYLGLADTAEHRIFMTALESRKLARVIRECFGRRRVYVILDACFAASAVADWQGGALDAAVRRMAAPLPRRGTAFLAASSKDRVALAPRSQRHTVFTGALLGALGRGVPARGERVSLQDLFEAIRDLIDEQALGRGRPELHAPRQDEGDVSRLPLFPNAAWRAAALDARVASPDPGAALGDDALREWDALERTDLNPVGVDLARLAARDRAAAPAPAGAPRPAAGSDPVAPPAARSDAAVGRPRWLWAALAATGMFGGSVAWWLRAPDRAPTFGLAAPKVGDEPDAARDAAPIDAAARLELARACLPVGLRAPGAPRLALGQLDRAAVLCAVPDRGAPSACWKVELADGFSPAGALTPRRAAPLPGQALTARPGDAVLAPYPYASAGDAPVQLAFSDDGEALAIRSGDRIRTYDASSPRPLHEIALAHEPGLAWGALHWIGHTIFVEGTRDGALGVWAFDARDEGAEILAPATTGRWHPAGSTFVALDLLRVGIAAPGLASLTVYDLTALHSTARPPARDRSGALAPIVTGTVVRRACPAPPCDDDPSYTGADLVAGTRSLVALLRGPRLGEIAVLDPATLAERRTIQLPWCP